MNEQELENLVESDLVRAFRKLYSKYEWARRGVVTAIILIALGCAGGLLQVNHLSKERKADTVRIQREICHRSNEGRVVLRQLIVTSTRPNTIKVRNPDLQKAISDANAKAKHFRMYAINRLPLADCSIIK